MAEKVEGGLVSAHHEYARRDLMDDLADRCAWITKKDESLTLGHVLENTVALAGPSKPGLGWVA
jgi:hypothetical protein